MEEVGLWQGPKSKTELGMGGMGKRSGISPGGVPEAWAVCVVNRITHLPHMFMCLDSQTRWQSNAGSGGVLGNLGGSLELPARL